MNQGVETRLLRTIRDILPGEHLCFLYESEEERRALVTTFLLQGLEKGERAFYGFDSESSHVVLDSLRQEGVDVKQFLDGGQLCALMRTQTHLQQSQLYPDALISLLKAEAERAAVDGYQSMRFAVEITRTRRGFANPERMIEFARLLDQAMQDSNWIGLCQYDERVLDSVHLLDVLRLHPLAMVHGQLYDHFYCGSLAAYRDRLSEATPQQLPEVLAEKQKADDRMRVLTELTRLVTARFEIDTVLSASAKALADLQPEPTTIGIFKCDYEKETVSVAALHEDTPPAQDQEPLTLKKVFSLQGTRFASCLESRRVLYTPDLTPTADTPVRSLAMNGILSDVMVPVLFENRPLAVLTAGRRNVDAFANDEIVFMARMADHLSMILNCSQLYAQLRVAYEERKKLDQEKVHQEQLRSLKASILANDCNNALTPFVSMTEMMLTQPEILEDRKKTEDYLTIMNAAAQDVVAQVKQLRDFHVTNDELESMELQIERPGVEKVFSATPGPRHDRPLLQAVVMRKVLDLYA